eukprot:comp22387_c0_seq1/m.33392 comp22387_c0_seq1/g.33392  ORF comp22387_c0_seq1/g.33392 comp22387_c0_seq1/m.33392 type:complete len:378 (-) comp22387_c0_seq1:246-1379(-)
MAADSEVTGSHGGLNENDSGLEQHGVTPVDTSNRNLIINYLPHDLSETELRVLFERFGPVENVKVVLNKATRISMGYGFVVMAHDEHAVQAQQAMNGMTIRGKRLKVSMARKSSEDIQRANLYVSGLPLEYDEEALRVLFAPYGVIIETKILRDQHTHVSRGSGFVRFSLRSEAETAQANLHNYRIPGTDSPLIVKFANTGLRRKGPRGMQRFMLPGGMPMAPQAYGAVGTLGLGMGAAGLGAMQMPLLPPMARSVTNGVNPMAAQQASAYGAAAVNMASYSVGALAPPAGMDGRGVGQYSLFVFNLPHGTSDQILYGMFAQFGPILSVRVMQGRGYAFVNYADYSAAQAAIAAMDGYQLGTKALHVAFKTDRRPKA